MPNRVEILIQDQPRSGPIATQFQKRKHLFTHLAGYGEGISLRVAGLVVDSGADTDAQEQSARATFLDHLADSDLDTDSLDYLLALNKFERQLAGVVSELRNGDVE
jgi:hypothetical protein